MGLEWPVCASVVGETASQFAKQSWSIPLLLDDKMVFLLTHRHGASGRHTKLDIYPCTQHRIRRFSFVSPLSSMIPSLERPIGFEFTCPLMHPSNL